MIAPFSIRFKAWADALPTFNSNEEAAQAIGIGKAYWAGLSHVAGPGALQKTI
jgi:hypothetical protein